jgi:hypothetical protein
MSYRERQRLADIQAAIDAIGSHLQRGDLTDGLVFDGVRIRLLEMDTVDEDLPDLERAIQALIRSAEKEDPDAPRHNMTGHLGSRGGSRARSRLIGTTRESSMIISRGAQIRTLCAPASTE